jgi:hypothetical protein
MASSFLRRRLGPRFDGCCLPLRVAETDVSRRERRRDLMVDIIIVY